MNNFTYNSMLLVLLIIIVGCAFRRGEACYDSILFHLFNVEKKTYNEAFIPKIVKETYRPLERNIKRNFEEFYDKSSTDISNVFRKLGIL
jgi:hypothetical protein